MVQEDKELLLIDLCARLPYGVNCKGFYYEEPDYKTPYEHMETCKGHVDSIDRIGFDDGEIYVIIEGIPCELSNIKPYLRPMESMTEEEKKELFKLGYEGNMEYPYGIYFRCQDYLNKNHFDYRGLIERSLAIAITEKNNPYKD